MPGFEYSSSTPSTPNRSTNSRFSFGTSNNPSTTPAGAPPSSTGSYTPAGPAPSSFLESTMRSPTPNKSAFGYSEYSQQSEFGHSQSEFGHSELQSPQFSSPLFTRPVSKPQRTVFGNKSQKSQRSLRSPSGSEEDEEEEDDENTGFGTKTRKRYADSYDDDQDVESEDGNYEEEGMDDYQSDSRGTNLTNRNIFYQHGHSVRFASTSEDMRQSEGNQLINFGGSLAQSQGEKVPSSDFASIAKSLSQSQGIPAVDEEDDLILRTEAIITKLYEQGVGTEENEGKLQRALAIIPSELTALWQEYSERSVIYNEQDYASVIGPGPAASDFAKANYLAHLALQIHHSKPVEKGFATVVKPLPQIMLDWLEVYHDPFPHQLQEIQASRPSPASHHLFWTTIHNNVVRGRLIAVINCLKSAGWRYSWSDADDLNSQGGADGFTGVALQNVEKVIEDAINVLSLCPAVHGDWDIHGSDWRLFRLRISQATEDLKQFAEGGAHRGFGRSSLKGSQGGDYSSLVKKAASRVPWNIYQNLLTLYSLVMGESIPIIENSQDWCEATIGLLVWHDEEREDRRFAPGRSINSLRASAINYESENDLRKLRRSFEVVAASNTDFHVNSNDMVEVGLACLFQGDAESLICILRAWSGPVSSALAEVASLAGWLPRTEPQGLLAAGELDQEDLDLINFGGSAVQDGVKDLTLITYARSLQEVPALTTVTGNTEVTKEGWELAISVLGRLDSEKRSVDMVEEVMKSVKLDSAGIVDKLWRLLNDLGMSSQAESIAMLYADSLARDNISPGEALWYYALAHNSAKVKDVLDTLIQLCLVYSTAYPPEAELDDHLQRLILSPKNALNEMSSMDLEAAELVHTSLSGYATLRRFYSLRDQEVLLSPGSKPSLGAIARKSEAANALLALIISSGDSIRGGIYDEDRATVIPVHYILSLLGEAMPFVNQPDSLLNASQIDILLRTIEDIQSIGPRIYSVCNAFLETVIKNASGLKGSTPMDLLSQSSSGTSGSFSMVGSSMMASQFHKSVTASGLLNKENIKRGWDWRKGIKSGTTADDILRILRLGLAKDLARAWLEETDNML